MTSRFSKLFLAAAVAASLPVAAIAGDCDHDHDRGRHEQAARPAPWRPAPPPHRFGEASWRERELHRLRIELRALDAERAEFHARFAWNPRKLRRYDRSYLERRAELERRWSELQLVAWR